MASIAISAAIAMTQAVVQQQSHPDGSPAVVVDHATPQPKTAQVLLTFPAPGEKVTSCTIVRSSGDKHLDQLTCDAMMKATCDHDGCHGVTLPKLTDVKH